MLAKSELEREEPFLLPPLPIVSLERVPIGSQSLADAVFALEASGPPEKAIQFVPEP